MTAGDFNEKYKLYLEEGHYGLDINIPEIVSFLDNVFEDLIKIPGFEYTQIKLKFGYGRFYSTLGRDLSSLIENEITRISKTYYNVK